jgi:transposase
VSAQKLGRPTKLTPELADRLVALLGAGSTVTAAARELGVSRRSIHYWRSRAWSRRDQDRPFVELERRIVAARLWALRPPAQSWRQSAAFLETEFPQRWGVHEGAVDKLLAELDNSWPEY